ncbi:hypothetical protein [Microbacterium sp. B19]|uniref:hypothetical protein n=1 Tax=Microbacterium sp. B19 TaxID=96765 RepID=UPI00034941CD|nr:hypothetical protein [Microbacterium sp. B19]
MRRQGRGTRVARGAAGASLATFVALLSHVTAGGDVPGWFGIVVPLALSFVVCTILAGRRLSVWRLAPAVALSQLLFHTLFVLGAPDSRVAGHVHGAARVEMTGPDLAMIAPDAAMWGWHLVAAAATTLALHRGERTLALLRTLADRAVEWLRARVAVASTVLVPTPRRRVLAEVVAVVRPTSVLLADSARRRGPPLGAH